MAGSRGFVLLAAVYWTVAAFMSVEGAASVRPQHGLRVTGYASTHWSGARIFEGLDATLSNELLGNRPFPGWQVYSLEWNGALVVAQGGHYTFSLASDDGSSLDVDGATVVANAGLDRRHAETGGVTLTAGVHAVRLRYFQNGGRYGINVLWAMDGAPLQPIPEALLLPELQSLPQYRWGQWRAAVTLAALLAVCGLLFLVVRPVLWRIARTPWGHAVDGVAAAVSRPRVAVACIVAAGIVPRVILYLTTPAVLWPDSQVFHVTALNILHGQWLDHDAYRTALYPYFMAGFLAWDRTPAIGDLLTVTQQELGLLTAVILYHVVRRACPPVVAAVAALLVAVHPLQLFYEVSILTETLFTLTLVITLWVAVRLFEQPHRWWAAALGLMAALLVLVRPVAQWYVACLLCVTWFAVPRRQGRLALIAVALLCYAVPLIGWMAVNQREYGFFGISLGRGMGLYTRVFAIDGLTPAEPTAHPDVRALWDLAQAERWSPNRVRDELNYSRGYTGAGADEAMFGFALETLAAHPLTFAWGTARQWLVQLVEPDTGVRTCLSPQGTFLCSGRMDGESLPPFPNLPPPAPPRLRALVNRVMTEAAVRFGAVLLLALAGVAAWWRGARREAVGAILILTAVYFTLVPAASQVAQDRFRLPVDGVFLLFAVWGARDLGVRALGAQRGDEAADGC